MLEIVNIFLDLRIEKHGNKKEGNNSGEWLFHEAKIKIFPALSFKISAVCTAYETRGVLLIIQTRMNYE